jgi:hypothetical protein
MAVFLLTYDLMKNKDYKRLTDELSRLDARKILLSAWLLDLNNTATEVLEHFTDFIDSDDKLFVAELTKRPKTVRAFKGTSDWLDAHLA